MVVCQHILVYNIYMISSQLQTTISERIAQMPEYMQDTLSAVPWLDILMEIAGKFRLGESQTQSLVSETALVLLELIDPSLYKTNLINHLAVSGDIADQIIADVLQRIVNRLQTEQMRIVGDDPQIFINTLAEMGVTEANTPNVEQIIAGIQAPKAPAQNTNTIMPNQQQNIYKTPEIQISSVPSSAIRGGDPYHESID
jgi:hypothetical protein